MKYFAQLMFVASLFLLGSCAATKDYKAALESHSISGYDSFIQTYPDHKKVPIAKAYRDTLQEDQDWAEASSAKSIDGYAKYLNDHPTGRFVDDAKTKKFVLEDARDWDIAEQADTVPQYNWYLDKYPNSAQKQKAQDRIDYLEEEYLWAKILKVGKSESFRYYMDKYPDGRHTAEAKRIEPLVDGARAEYERLMRYPIPRGSWTVDFEKRFISYLDKYPDVPPFTELAKKRLDEVDDALWESCLEWDAKLAYRMYLRTFPDGRHAKDAERRQVDLEVAEMFKQNNGALPQMEGVRPSNPDRLKLGYSVIDVLNDTKYTLTLYYSGPDSKIVHFKPGEEKSFEMMDGNYRVVASVNAWDVTRYAGTAKLESMIYSSSFFIETTPY